MAKLPAYAYQYQQAPLEPICNDIKTLYEAQNQTMAHEYPNSARFRRARDSSCSRQRLLRRESWGPAHSARLRVAAALVDPGSLERRGRMRQRRHARA